MYEEKNFKGKVTALTANDYRQYAVELGGFELMSYTVLRFNSIHFLLCMQMSWEEEWGPTRVVRMSSTTRAIPQHLVRWSQSLVIHVNWLRSTPQLYKRFHLKDSRVIKYKGKQILKIFCQRKAGVRTVQTTVCYINAAFCNDKRNRERLNLHRPIERKRGYRFGG